MLPSTTSPSGPPAVGEPSIDAGADGTIDAGADGTTEGQPENHPELASGMLRTTALDMARYVAALENDGELDGRRILSALSANEMKRRQLSANLPSCNSRTVAGDQGLLAYWTKDSVDEYFGHAGGMKGVGADVFYRASDGAGFVVLGNVASDAWVNDVEIALLTAANKL